MFQLHESTQRAWVQLLWILLVIAPTGATIGWAVWIRTDSHQEACRLALSQRLGWPLTIDAVSHPRPGATRVAGLQVADPESGGPLLNAQQLEIARRVVWMPIGHGIPSGVELTCRASGAELTPRGSEWLWDNLRRTLRGHHYGPQQAVRLSADRVTLVGGPTPIALGDLEAGIVPHAQRSDAYLGFLLADRGDSQRITLRVVRDHLPAAPRTALELKTGGQPLPCRALAAIFPTQDWLGEAAQFRGTLVAAEAADGWSVELVGGLSEVDLDRMVTDHFAPHELSGLARIELEYGLIRAGRMERLEGTLATEQGRVSRSLLAAAQEPLQFHVRPGSETWPANLLFESLAFQFSLGAKGLSVSAVAPESQGIILSDREGPLVAAQGVAVSPAGLVEALAGESRLRMPHSSAGRALLSRLPSGHEQVAANPQAMPPR